MRYFLFLLVFAGLNACQEPESAKLAVQEKMEKQRLAWNGGNLDGFLYHYWHSEDLTFVTKSGVTRGFDEVSKRYTKAYGGPEMMGKLSYEIIDLKELGKGDILCTGRWALEGFENNPSGYFTLVWREVAGEWKIVYDHTS